MTQGKYCRAEMPVSSTLFCLAVLFAITVAMPTQKLVGSASADLVMNSCMDTTNSSIPPNQLAEAIPTAPRPDETTLLALLNIQLAGLNENVKVFQGNFSNWNIYKGTQLKQLQQSISPAFSISPKQRIQLTKESNARVNFTSQLAIYANFLKSQETDPSYGQGQQPIANVVKELVQTICTLKMLLHPAVTNDDLRAYVTEDCNLPELNVTSEKPAIKKAVTSQVLIMMSASVNQFLFM